MTATRTMTILAVLIFALMANEAQARRCLFGRRHNACSSRQYAITYCCVPSPPPCASPLTIDCGDPCGVVHTTPSPSPVNDGNGNSHEEPPVHGGEDPPIKSDSAGGVGVGGGAPPQDLPAGGPPGPTATSGGNSGAPNVVAPVGE